MSAATLPAPAEVETPRVRRTLRRRLFWIGAAVVALVGAFLSILLGASGIPDVDRYSLDNAGEGGSRAVAEVLRQQGVDVVAADSLAEAQDAVAAADGRATILFADLYGYLDDERLGALAETVRAGNDLVLVDPGSSELEALTDGIRNAGAAQPLDTVEPGSACRIPAAERAGAISTPTNAYRTAADGDAATCYPSYDDAFALLQQDDGGGTVTVLGAGDVLTNDRVTLAGNAALALGLLGENETLVWYRASTADVPAGATPPSLGELTPGWVTPVLLLGILVVIAAGVWRGRRFGPVVVENLPVTVRASETSEGRARLYAKEGAHGRALDALRIGTIGRLTGLLNLPRYADVVEVSRSVAAVTGRHVDEVYDILLGSAPRSEAELLDTSDRLLVLEQQVRRATDPAATGGSG